MAGIKKSKLQNREMFFFTSLLFLGLAIIMISKTNPTTAQRLIIFYQSTISSIAGGIIIFFALSLHETVRDSIKGITSHKKFRSSTVWTATTLVTIGISLGIAWTHCLDPVLSMIITTASKPNNLLTGYFLLTLYYLGLSIPFIALGVTLNAIANKFKLLIFASPAITFISRIIIIMIGALLIYTPGRAYVSGILVGAAPLSMSHELMRRLVDLL